MGCYYGCGAGWGFLTHGVATTTEGTFHAVRNKKVLEKRTQKRRCTISGPNHGRGLDKRVLFWEEGKNKDTNWGGGPWPVVQSEL